MDTLDSTSLLDCKREDLDKLLIVAYRKAKADVFYQSTDRLKLLRYEKNLASNLETLRSAILNGPKDPLFAKLDFTGTATFAPKSLTPTTADIPQRPKDDGFSLVFTSPTEQWEQKVSNIQQEDSELTATFRLMSDCEIGLHVLSALWIMCVGEKIEKELFPLQDAAKGTTCAKNRTLYANRIRRTKAGAYNSTSIGTFEKYLDGYRAWINDATEAMDHLVRHGKKVVSFSTDAAEYFHSIPASILNSKPFTDKYLKSFEKNSLELLLTSCLSVALKSWETNTTAALKLSSNVSDVPQLGLPVGLSCSAVLGNIVLSAFDEAVTEQIKPAFYGRYVDDITIVMEWHKELDSPLSVWRWLSTQIPNINVPAKDASQEEQQVSFEVFPLSEHQVEDNSSADGLSITFKHKKTKLLTADPSSGKRAIDALKHALRENSSEWRLLTHTPNDPQDIGPALITALDDAGEPAFRSSQLKTLSSKRSTISVWLREFEQLGRLCKPQTWRQHRVEFYQVIEEQIITPLNVTDYFGFIGRVFTLALNCGDYTELDDLVKAMAKAIEALERFSTAKINPEKLETELSIFDVWRSQTLQLVHELIVASDSAKISASQKNQLYRKALNQLTKHSAETFPDEMNVPDSIDDEFIELFSYDLALIPFKEVLCPMDISTINPRRSFPQHLFFETGARDILNLREYEEEGSMPQEILTKAFPQLKSSPLTQSFWHNIILKSYLPDNSAGHSEGNTLMFRAVVFPTRPLSVPQAISWSGYLTPNSETSESPQKSVKFRELSRWVGFLRGFSLRSAIEEDFKGTEKLISLDIESSEADDEVLREIFGVSDAEGTNRKIIAVPSSGVDSKGDPKIAVTSIFTSPERITLSIAGKNNLDYQSYRDFSRLIDQIVKPIPEGSKPDYVLFPELSLPAPWFEWFGSHLASKYGIGLISGITYLTGRNDGVVHNQIWASLPTSVFGFRTAAIYRQDKQHPAYGEEQNLSNFQPQKRLVPQIEWSTPPVIKHGNLSFSLLICSELTNIKYRADLRGRIDVLFVAEKNRDLNTFEALVDSAALDIHAYIAQSNTREYGDSRIRAPRKESHERDIVRVRGGLNDHFVVGQIEVNKLRNFQSWHFKNTDFKPLPDGFHENFDPSRESLP